MRLVFTKLRGAATIRGLDVLGRGAATIRGLDVLGRGLVPPCTRYSRATGSAALPSNGGSTGPYGVLAFGTGPRSGVLAFRTGPRSGALAFGTGPLRCFSTSGNGQMPKISSEATGAAPPEPPTRQKYWRKWWGQVHSMVPWIISLGTAIISMESYIIYIMDARVEEKMNEKVKGFKSDSEGEMREFRSQACAYKQETAALLQDLKSTCTRLERRLNSEVSVLREELRERYWKMRAYLDAAERLHEKGFDPVSVSKIFEDIESLHQEMSSLIARLDSIAADIKDLAAKVPEETSNQPSGDSNAPTADAPTAES